MRRGLGMGRRLCLGGERERSEVINRSVGTNQKLYFLAQVKLGCRPY